MGPSGSWAAAATTSQMPPVRSRHRNTITITPTTAARRLLACLTVLSPFCIMRSQALSTQPVILELDDQGTPPGASCAWPRASIACSLVPPNTAGSSVAASPATAAQALLPLTCASAPLICAEAFTFRSSRLALAGTAEGKPASSSSRPRLELSETTRTSPAIRLDESKRCAASRLSARVPSIPRAAPACDSARFPMTLMALLKAAIPAFLTRLLHTVVRSCHDARGRRHHRAWVRGRHVSGTANGLRGGFGGHGSSRHWDMRTLPGSLQGGAHAGLGGGRGVRAERPVRLHYGDWTLVSEHRG